MRRFDDLQPGDVYDCGSTNASREEMLAFADEFDPLPIHTDPEAAAASPFGGLIASGIHTLALSQRRVVEAFYADSALIAAMGMESIRLPTPLYPDREMHVTLEILDTRVSESNPDRGIVTLRRVCETTDGVVLEFTNDTLWQRA